MDFSALNGCEKFLSINLSQTQQNVHQTQIENQPTQNHEVPSQPTATAENKQNEPQNQDITFLKDLQKAKLKPTKTKIKNVDGSISKESPYKQKKAKIWECPDIHLPKNKYVAMEDNDNKDNKDDKQVHSIHITHCSDTHQKHYRMQSLIPFGDILIHSGDFVTSCYWKNGITSPQKLEKYIIKNNITTPQKLKKYIPSEIIDFNEWIGTLPHKHKIVIAGNHECIFNDLSKEFIQKYLLTNCIYLQDSYISLYGLTIYGSPWTTNSGMAFSFNGDWEFLYDKWRAIPTDTDILVTHMPPLGIFDLAWGRKYNNRDKCKLCGDIHEKYAHWGCGKLLIHVQQRIKPNVHLFGHVHDETGFKMDDCGTLFVNSAMDIHNKAHRMKIIFDL